VLFRSAVAVSSDFANDNTVIIANATTVFRSVDGGMTFNALPVIAGLGANTITSVDAGPAYQGGSAYLVGATSAAAGTGAAFRLNTNEMVWKDLTIADDPNVAGTQTADIYGVAFSPNYRSDAEVFAVGGDATGSHLYSKIAERNANADFCMSNFTTMANNANMKASIAFPADFSTNLNVLVGLGLKNPVALAAVAAPAGADAYRVALRSYIAGSLSINTRLNVQGSGNNANVFSLAFKGNLADGWLYIGQQDNNVIRRATAVGGTPAFYDSVKSPSGTVNTVIEASPVANDANVFALTSGANSSFAVSTDNGNNFNMISFINITASYNFKGLDIKAVDANNIYELAYDDVNAGGTFNAGDRVFLFKTTNAGANWQGVFTFVAPTGASNSLIFLSPAYAAATPDNTLYLPVYGTSSVYKSSDAGVSFISYPAGSINITAFAAVDANNFFIGGANAVGKGGYTTPPTISGDTPSSIAYVSATDMFVGVSAGTLYRSTNGGLTFAPIGTPRSLGAVRVVWVDTGYATNKNIYVGTATGMWRWTIDTSSVWTQILPVVVGSACNITSISQTADGTMYANDAAYPSGVAGITAQIWRSTNPTAAPATNITWDSMIPYIAPSPVATGLAGYAQTNNTTATIISSAAVAAVATGTTQVPNNTIYSLASIYNLLQTTTGTASGTTVYAVKDTVVAAPAPTAPAADAQVATTANFTWTASATTYTPVKYDFQVAYDSAFNSKLADYSTGSTSGPYSGTLFAATNLQQGQTYYWRVRVSNQNPMASKWSAATKFSVMLSNNNYALEGVGGLSMQPSAGATNVPLKPVFQWALVTGAVSYDLQVSDNPVFVNPLDAQTGLNTNVWTLTKNLDPGKTYYWRVRAISASNVASAWVSSAFTTSTGTTVATGAPVATQPVFTITQPPAQTVVITQPPAQTVVITQAAPTSTAPSTPASIWVLIAIGAILIIAVIVLIARTRRV